MKKFRPVVIAIKDFKYYLLSAIITLIIIAVNILYFFDAGSHIEASSAANEAVKNESAVLRWVREIFEWLIGP